MQADAWAAVRALRRRHRRRRQPVVGHTGALCGRCDVGYHATYDWGRALCLACPANGSSSGFFAVLATKALRPRPTGRTCGLAGVDDPGGTHLSTWLPRSASRSCTHPPPLPAAVLLGMRRPGRRGPPGTASPNSPSQSAGTVPTWPPVLAGRRRRDPEGDVGGAGGGGRRPDCASRLCRPTLHFARPLRRRRQPASLAPTSARLSSRASRSTKLRLWIAKSLSGRPPQLGRPVPAAVAAGVADALAQPAQPAGEAGLLSGSVSPYSISPSLLIAPRSSRGAAHAGRRAPGPAGCSAGRVAARRLPVNAGFKGTTPPAAAAARSARRPSDLGAVRRRARGGLFDATPAAVGAVGRPADGDAATGRRARGVAASSTSQYPGMSRLSLDSRRTSDRASTALKRGASRGGGAAVGGPVRRGRARHQGCIGKGAAPRPVQRRRSPASLAVAPLPAPSLETAPELPSPPPSPPARGEGTLRGATPTSRRATRRPTPAQAAEAPMVDRAPRYKRASDRRTSRGRLVQSDTKRFGERGRAFGFVILSVEQLYAFERSCLRRRSDRAQPVLRPLPVLAMVVPAIKVAWRGAAVDRALSTIALDWPVVTFSLRCVRPLLYYDVLRGAPVAPRSSPSSSTSG